jgi:hypothetical protein
MTPGFARRTRRLPEGAGDGSRDGVDRVPERDRPLRCSVLPVLGGKLNEPLLGTASALATHFAGESEEGTAE